VNAVASSQDAVNRRVYHQAGVEKVYQSRNLQRIEAIALLRHQPLFAGKDVLDVGVGTGRTTAYLQPLCARYEGIDYSPVMVQHMQSAWPAISVRLADMRELVDFADATFDFVFAPNNVLDAVGHEDRLRALGEFRRVLRPGGTLIFASHNRAYRRALGGPRLAFSRNPVRQCLLLAEFLRQWGNHLRVKSLRAQTQEYALLNDSGHDYACLHYYIGQSGQRRQLAGVGFAVTEVLDEDGNPLGAGEAAADSAHLMYVARVATR
jgi:SAM-dependent methyltransferase